MEGGHKSGRSEPPAIEEAFGADADYATITKIYKTDPKAAQGRHSPPVRTDIKTPVVGGEPDAAHTSTSSVERSNLSIRCRTVALPG